MPLSEHAPTTITAFGHTPRFAHGHVRDLRVRWACEEIGRPYRVELLDAMTPRDDAYRSRQPFGQVPVFDDGAHVLFESGAILMYLGEQDERLLPRDGDARWPDARWQAISWCFAALNSVEPQVMAVAAFDMFHRRKEWAAGARAAAAKQVEQRLAALSGALGTREWLAGPFSIADILMVDVLRNLDHTDLLAPFPDLAAYKARGEARPGFRQALADQLAGLGVAPATQTVQATEAVHAQGDQA